MTAVIKKGEPIRLPDGSLLLPNTNDAGKRVITSEEVAAQEAHEEVSRELSSLLNDPTDNELTTTVKRTLADVDIPFGQMNAYMLLVGYTLWGLDSFAISKLMNVTQDSVERLITQDSFAEIRQQLIEAIRHAEAATVHGFLASKSIAAAKTVVSTLTNPSGDLKLAAAKDILDRSGFRPADRIEHVHRFEDELRIRYVSDETPPQPTIDMDM